MMHHYHNFTEATQAPRHPSPTLFARLAVSALDVAPQS